MKKTLLLILSTLCLNPVFGSTQAESTPNNIVVFGDSLSDGFGNYDDNNNYFANDWWQQTPGVTPYNGIEIKAMTDGIPVTSSNTGERTGALTWVNYLVNSKQVTSSDNLYNYLDAFKYHPEIDFSTANLNFAFAGSQTADNYVDNYAPTHPPFTPIVKNKAILCNIPGVKHDYACLPGLLKQVKELYLTQVDHINSNTKFIIFSGANDLVQEMEMAQGRYTESQIIQNIQKPINNITTAIQLLHQHGASLKNIYVVRLFNLADTPSYSKNNHSISTNAIRMISGLFNDNLTYAVLKKGIPPKNIVYLDILFHHTVSLTRENNSYYSPEAEYSFNNIGNCVNDGKNPSCENYIFFNSGHPSTNMHKAIANYMLEHNLSK